jgi:formylglycine-generating enzyme required for sulfatase activity
VSGYFLNNPNSPVVNVTWDQAAAYANWIGKRLPTEAEWEKAARGGLEGKAYSWGDDDPSTRCNYLGYNGPFIAQMPNFSSGRGPLPKGLFQANGYGIYDITGNVREWCNDLYNGNYYANSPDHNPQGPTSATQRVLRDGSWSDTDASSLRSAIRFHRDPYTNDRNTGFRCAKTP